MSIFIIFVLKYTINRLYLMEGAVIKLVVNNITKYYFQKYYDVFFGIFKYIFIVFIC